MTKYQGKHYEPQKRNKLVLIIAAVILLAVAAPFFKFMKNVFLFKPGSRSGELPVLCYHCIDEVPSGKNNALYISPKEFEKQIRYLSKKGYEFLTPSNMEGWDKKSKAVIVTFDDGYEDNYLNAAPILEKYKGKATVFMVSSKVGTENRLTQDQLREMAESGLWEIGSHGTYHKDLTLEPKEVLNQELGQSLKDLEELTGSRIVSIAYPHGACNQDLADIASLYYDYGFISEHTSSYSNYIYPREGIFGYYKLWQFKLIMNMYF